jgi:PhnB protein
LKKERDDEMTQGSETKDKAEIRALLEERIVALRDKDADLALSGYAADVVSFDLAPPLRHVGAQVLDKAAIESWFSTWRGPIGWEIRDLDIAAEGGLAFAHALNRMTGTKTDGEKIDLWVRSTACLRRTGRKWAIVHEHTSVPFYMDGSYRAAVDLKP